MRLPRVARHGPHCARIEPSISLVVVLPLLPATPRTVPSKAARQARAAAVSARPTSATTTCGNGDVELAADDRAGRAGRRGRGDEVVAVGARARQREEQVAARERA